MSEPASGDAIREVLGSISAREALDVGCGTGDFTRLLADSVGGVRTILGIDPDKDSIDEARRLTADRRIRYRVFSIFDAPFSDGRFDLGAVSNVLHHVEDPVALLRELGRLVAPGAPIVVAELVSDALSPAESTGRDLHHLKALIDRSHGRVHRPTFTRREIRAILREAGIAVEMEREITDPAPGHPGDERVESAYGFLADYLERATGLAEEAAIRAEASRIVGMLPATGIATPPRLLVRGTRSA